MQVQLKFTEGNYAELAGVFGLLSQLWNVELDAAMMRTLKQPDIASVWQKLGGQVPGSDPETLESLAVDYCQLIVGPKNHLSPVQSVWVDGRFGGEPAGSMQQFIDMLQGFEPCNRIIDHIAVQLQYMAAVMGIAEQTPRKLWEGLATRFCARAWMRFLA